MVDIFDPQSQVLDSYNANLPNLIQMNRNLMWFPTSVLNSKFAFNKKIKIEWESLDKVKKQKQKHSFEFAPMEGNPLPLAEHSKLLDAMLALYSNNMDNEIGRLYFRMSDVADIAAKKYTEGFRVSLAETIYRYMRCIAFFQNAYLSNGQRGNLSCTPIEETSLWDKDAGVQNYNERLRIKSNSPRNSRDKSTWHIVRFNKTIAEGLHNKDTRLFLSEVLKSDLKPVPYIIYRYFYAFSDINYVERDLFTLCKTFGFSNMTTFADWFRVQLDSIADTTLIENYEWPSNVSDLNKAIVRVKCKSFTQKSPIKALDFKKLKDIDNLTNLALIEYYIEFKKRNLISEETVSVLDEIEKASGKPLFFQMLKGVLKKAAVNFNNQEY